MLPNTSSDLIDKIENKIENIRLPEYFRKKVLLEVSYFAINIYETKTLT